MVLEWLAIMGMVGMVVRFTSVVERLHSWHLLPCALSICSRIELMSFVFSCFGVVICAPFMYLRSTRSSVISAIRS